MGEGAEEREALGVGVGAWRQRKGRLSAGRGETP